MITYKASDIIKRATQLADIENSDYISWNEKIGLLNEAYVALYQKLVDLNDNCIVCSFETNEKIIPLPPNFWQLKSVLQVGGRGNCFPIMKRAPNQDSTTNTYDLRNDAIIINGYPRNVRIEYYAIPQTITFPNKTLELDLSSIVDMYKSTALVTTSSGLGYQCYGLRDINDPSFTIDFTQLDAGYYTPIVFNAECIVFKREDEPEFKVYSFLTDEFSTVSGDYKPAIYKDRCFAYKEGALYFITSPLNKALDVELIDTTDTTIIIYDNVGNTIQLKNGHININDEDWPTKMNIKKLIVRDKIITGVTDSDYYITIQNGRISENMSEFAVVSAIDNNDDTGYGYIGKRMGKYFIISNLEDTKLNFPNSFYFTLLSYKLALAFKIKQGADVSQLSALYQDAENTFTNTLTSDDWSVTRITNVY